MSDEEKRPIIIRRKVVKGGGHHGGAWKVAYADFVTAMMAFFLLMWLLNATTEEQRKGLADYFSPSIPLHRTSGGGQGPFGGASILAEQTQAQNGTGATRDRPAQEHQAKGDTGVDDQDSPDEPTAEGIAGALIARGGESDIPDDVLAHVRVRRTDEGVVIEVSELPGFPLFSGQTAEPSLRLGALMRVVADVVAAVRNPVAVDAHVETPAIAVPSDPGWVLTADRAMAARTLLAEAGIAAPRFARIAGEADRAPSWPEATDIRNRRLEIVLLHRDPGTEIP